MPSIAKTCSHSNQWRLHQRCLNWARDGPLDTVCIGLYLLSLQIVCSSTTLRYDVPGYCGVFCSIGSGYRWIQINFCWSNLTFYLETLISGIVIDFEYGYNPLYRCLIDSYWLALLRTQPMEITLGNVSRWMYFSICLYNLRLHYHMSADESWHKIQYGNSLEMQQLLHFGFSWRS